MSGYGATDVARFVVEAPKGAGHEGRTAFQRDRARVLHSSALRRLAGKTQVVGVGEDDFPRTRLTHSLECAQIGRELAAALGMDADLVDAACLAHDLGHPPFGHNGEAALDAMAGPCGGFEGNAQSFRLLTRIEPKVDGAGLNLTRATLDAATKYPWARRPDRVKYGVYADDEPVFGWVRTEADGQRRCLEAQVMDWADDVAYSVHDLEDGVHGGHVDLRRLDIDAVAAVTIAHYDAGADVPATVARLRSQPWWATDYDGSPGALRALKSMTSHVIGRFCAAVIEATRAEAGPGPHRRYATNLVVPAHIRAECAVLKGIADHHVMRRAETRELQSRQRTVITELVTLLAAAAPVGLEPLLIPSWLAAADDAARLRVLIDQVAGLTDASAVALHRRLRSGRSSSLGPT